MYKPCWLVNILRRFKGSKCPHLRSRSIYKKVPRRKIWVPCLSFRPTCSCSAWPRTGKHKDSSTGLKFLYIYECLSYLTLTKRFVLVLRKEYYRNLKITEPGIGCVLPKFSFQTPSLKFCHFAFRFFPHLETPNNFIKYSTSWKADSLSASTEIPLLIWNPEVYWLLRTNSSVSPNMYQTNPVHNPYIPLKPLFLHHITFSHASNQRRRS